MDTADSARRENQSHRSIVSYVRRSPRMTASQKTWLDTYSPRWTVNVARGPLATSVAPQESLDLSAIFGRIAPTIVEIGSGHGETLIHAAAAHADIDFVGFEVFEASLAATLGKIAAAGLTNIRLIAADAVSGLSHVFADHSLAEIWVFFPDPWPKKRHHKRRLVSPAFADLVADKLVDHGALRLATDWPSYAETIDETLGADRRYALTTTDRFSLRPVTKFEARGIQAGRAIHDFTYHISGPSADPVANPIPAFPGGVS